MNTTRAATAFLVLAACSPLVRLAAQDQPRPQPRWGWTRPAAHYGKWLTVAAAAGLTVMGAREHDKSAVEWRQLLTICRLDNADCALGTDGSYVNPIAEAHYQRSVFYDARARRRLLGGQIALVVSAALFIADVKRGQNGPPNIPFDPNKLLVAPAAGGGTRVGLHLEF